ncbi:substrate-binding periplasmic protein [Salidesulfovibrio onnuriiensis]|uniref:substrate-binding periplasmic protein n=1 Tax=Salidesulfovibrio onnuriiensis TaxID=2583823 RepID=UPI0011CC932B|nr:transporter substrate-binding domain-containing protein [Salidesulfovibrio onnuriiensis]
MKYFRLCLTILLATLALPAWAYETTPLRLGMDIWPPYEFQTTSGRPAGIAFETTRTVLAEMGIELRSVEVLPWARGLKMLEHGEIDVLISGVRTKERESIFHYPEESIITAEWRAFVHCGQSNPAAFTTIETLDKKTVGTVRSYNYPEKFMKKLDSIALIDKVNTDETNFRKLVTDRVDVVLSDYLNGLWLLHVLQLNSQICVTPLPIGSRELYPLFSQKTVAKDIVDRFTERLRKFKATPEYAQLLNRVENLDR